MLSRNRLKKALFTVMSFLYALRRHLARLARKPRSRGFGVQSPWAYRFVREVAMGRDDGRGMAAFLTRLRAFCPKGRLTVLDISDSHEGVDAALNNANRQAAVAVTGIHRSKESLRRWHALCADSRTAVAFDLFDCGVLFFDHKMFKRTYKINYR